MDGRVRGCVGGRVGGWGGDVGDVCVCGSGVAVRVGCDVLGMAVCVCWGWEWGWSAQFKRGAFCGGVYVRVCARGAALAKGGAQWNMCAAAQ